MSNRVLVIDDDSGLLTLLSIGLGREGLDVITARDGRDGLRKAYECHPDVVILDITMPEMDGWTTCMRLRQVTDVPIIVLTALGDSDSVVKGLALGADDYVTKPCSFDVLKARIRTALRHRGERQNGDPETILNDGNLCIDLVRQTVTRQGIAIDLTPTESRLLLYLAQHRGRVVPHRELLTHVWGPQYANESKYLGVYVRYVRAKIEDDPSNPVYITTKHRVGYSFVMAPAVQSTSQ
jgi:two-component system KDP operon response regulator KdpE